MVICIEGVGDFFEEDLKVIVVDVIGCEVVRALVAFVLAEVVAFADDCGGCLEDEDVMLVDLTVDLVILMVVPSE